MKEFLTLSQIFDKMEPAPREIKESLRKNRKAYKLYREKTSKTKRFFSFILTRMIYITIGVILGAYLVAPEAYELGFSQGKSIGHYLVQRFVE